jgi:peptidoglycan/LPS O-acetylase OafA/YrhL
LLPILILWLSRKAALWKTVSVLAFFVALGAAIRWYVLLHVLRPLSLTNDGFGIAYIERIYYPTYTRLDGLLAGVAFALIRTFRPVWWAALSRRGHALFLSGLALIGISVWLFANRFESVRGVSAVGTVVGFPLLSLGLGLLVASSISVNGWLARVRIPGATLVATLAFSLYLTHKEAVHLDQRYLPRIVGAGLLPALALYGVSCLAVAGALYLCVERPFLILRDRRAGRRIEKPELTAAREPAL